MCREIFFFQIHRYSFGRFLFNNLISEKRKTKKLVSFVGLRLGNRHVPFDLCTTLLNQKNNRKTNSDRLYIENETSIQEAMRHNGEFRKENRKQH